MILAPLLHLLLLSLSGCTPTDTGAEVLPDCADGKGTSILLADGSPSGFEQCADGTIHRVSAETVDPTISLPSCVGDEEQIDCTSDAECTDGAHGKCVSDDYFDYYDYIEKTHCGCVYSCASDADCDAGEACIPTEVTGGVTQYAECRPAACATDDDCDAGACGLSNWHDGCDNQIGLYCHDPAVDTCVNDETCTNNDLCAYDIYAPEDGWACTSETCAIGRPLTTAHGPRTAVVRPRGDWAHELRPSQLNHLTAPERERLARHWRSVAALEHASVASFARFTLQLMALGAPPELLAETQMAAADEVRHAQLAYGLATAYGGVPVGPGPMELGDTTPCFDVVGVVRGLIAEACIGETLGAAEALYAAATCTDDVVAAILREIAEDESRHAALAWRTLQWLMERNPELPVAAWLEAALAEVAVDVEATSNPEAGVLGGPERQDAHRLAAVEVIRPTVARLLAA